MMMNYNDVTTTITSTTTVLIIVVIQLNSYVFAC
jgi:hypothetical protein